MPQKSIQTLLNNQVTISWDPGYQGYEGNETADRLANNGRKQPLTDPVTIRQPHREMEKKFDTYTNQSLMTRY